MPDLKGKERIDVTGFGTVRVIQDPDEFCYGVDAVILADIAARRAKPIRQDSRIMDLGTGSGIIPLILSHKTVAGHIYGVEVQRDSWDRAVRSAELNELTDRLEFINCDVNDILSVRPDLKMSFDVITCNPPYTPLSGGMKPESTAKMIARHETTAGIDDFIRVTSELLKDHGELFLVHRPSRMVDIFVSARKHKMEPKAARLVVPRDGEEPNIVLIHMIKNGGADLNILPPLAVHDLEGGFTSELKEAYL